MKTKVKFKSDGLTLSGILHVPDDLAPGERSAAFVVMHGFGGYKDGPEHVAQGKILCEWGYVTLRFDFRGCGESEGERGRLIIEEEVRDAIAAAEFWDLMKQPMQSVSASMETVWELPWHFRPVQINGSRPSSVLGVSEMAHVHSGACIQSPEPFGPFLIDWTRQNK